MARRAGNVEFTGSVTINGQIFIGTNIFEGFVNAKSSHHGHSNHGHDVIHLSEVEKSGSDVNLLQHPVTLTGSAADDLIRLFQSGGTVVSDSDTDGHHHG
jgi:hypothetical protein